jgi:hypothetical protein
MDAEDARDEWGEMLAKDLDTYLFADEDNQVYCLERSGWDHCTMWPPRP